MKTCSDIKKEHAVGFINISRLKTRKSSIKCIRGWKNVTDKSEEADEEAYKELKTENVFVSVKEEDFGMKTCSDIKKEPAVADQSCLSEIKEEPIEDPPHI